MMFDSTPSYLPPISMTIGIVLTLLATYIFPHHARRWGAAWILGLLFAPLISASIAGWPTLEQVIWQGARSAPIVWIGAAASFEALRAFDKIAWLNDRTRDITDDLNNKLDRLIQRKEQPQSDR